MKLNNNKKRSSIFYRMGEEISNNPDCLLTPSVTAIILSPALTVAVINNFFPIPALIIQGLITAPLLAMGGLILNYKYQNFKLELKETKKMKQEVKQFVESVEKSKISNCENCEKI